jgi:predicted chitinase/FMN phosphatase YigB (HAD superfamily)
MKIDILLNERTRHFQGSSLVIFDIDDTLLHTTAKINVVQDGQVVRSLTNQEFNNYQLQPGEEFDFGEFRNAEKFAQESKPIKPMINKLKTILRHADQTQSKVIMLTARADFDDKNPVLKTFHRYGIDMNRIHLYRAGNLPGDDPPALKKAVYVRKFLNTGEYNRVSLYDDSTSNLRAFKALQKEFPQVRFSAYHVSPAGNATQVETSMKEAVGDVVQIVEPHDTVYSIAWQNNLDPKEIMAANGFDLSTKLVPGQKVKIPPRTSSSPTPTKSKVDALLSKAKPEANRVLDKINQSTQPLPITKQPAESMLRDYAISKGIKGKELAQFMAQCAVESAGFTTTVEFASGADYEGRKDLGNMYKGDGIRYKGRGYIQLTGRNNYRNAGESLGYPLEKKPELVEQPAIAMKTSVWYWIYRVRTYQDLTDPTDSRQATKAVNGAYRGFTQRVQWFKKYLATMVNKPFKEDINQETSTEPELMNVFKDFFPLVMTMLKIDKLPPIKFKQRVDGEQPSFGGFDMNSGVIYLQIENRHPLDIIRTLAHELVHFRQHQNNRLPADGGKSGSPYENQANQLAGIIMRRFNQKFPHYFDSPAFTIHEGQHPNDPPRGPEFKPTMPAGTVKVDVSDVYDWYKLGQHISNLKGLGKHDFGKGPPSTIISFGSEEEEHEYIKALQKTGLTTTDIDPVDPKQPKGMKRQKTDPTYNVGENFADGKHPGRKGLAKRSGVNTKASVSSLRKTAKNSSGEKQRMAHWLANMKAGKAKKK